MTPTPPPSALFTDLYEITMAQAYWRSGVIGQATFSLMLRKLPRDRGYLVFMGLEDCLRFLEELRFAPEDLTYLESLGQFEPAFLQYLEGLRFTGSVRAAAEGGIVFANEPVIEVTGPMIEAQIVETYLLNQASLQTMLATKASRAVYAARGRTLVDFGARRTHGVDAADAFARASYVTGFAGTSNCQAGLRFGIPTYGTMAHSFVMSFESEAEAFRAFAETFPDGTTLLVDTYDTLTGVRHAIDVALDLQRQGHHLAAIRLDSGDLAELAKGSRRLLDEAGLEKIRIFASGGLDEFSVGELVESGAPIDAFGVGTKVGVSADAPWVDSAYKLVEYEGRPTLKLSEGKATLPGAKQVFRFRDTEDAFARDVIGLATEATPTGAQALLTEVMRDGKRTAPAPSLDELRGRFTKAFAALPEGHKALISPDAYDVSVSEALLRLQEEAGAQAR